MPPIRARTNAILPFPRTGPSIPFAGADPLFANEAHRLSLVEYLRLCVRWAGFPLLERRAAEKSVAAFVREFTVGLEPF